MDGSRARDVPRQGFLLILLGLGSGQDWDRELDAANLPAPPDAAPLAYFEAILKDSPQGTSNVTTRFQTTHFWWSDPTPRQLADYDADLAVASAKLKIQLV